MDGLFYFFAYPCAHSPPKLPLSLACTASHLPVDSAKDRRRLQRQTSTVKTSRLFQHFAAPASHCQGAHFLPTLELQTSGFFVAVSVTLHALRFDVGLPNHLIRINRDPAGLALQCPQSLEAVGDRLALLAQFGALPKSNNHCLQISRMRQGSKPVFSPG